MKRSFAISILLVLLQGIQHVQAQDSTSNILFSGYAEVFYGFDANRPSAGNEPAFLYNHNRHNEVNLNLGYLKAVHTTARTRANLAIGVGTYMADNYAAEPIGSRNLLEANLGLRINQKTWLDLGVMPSHIGFESAVSKDCWTLSRTLMAENSPYFETGGKLTHTPNAKWQFALLTLNGWQRISRADKAPALGTQVQWKPKDQVTVNWSTYAGHANRITSDVWRVFNNLYASFPLFRDVQMLVGLDIGMEGSDTWGTGVAMLRYQPTPKWSLAAKVENYTDKKGLVIGLPEFATSGSSANVDFSVTEQTVVRFELRYLNAQEAIFNKENGASRERFSGLFSIASSF